MIRELSIVDQAKKSIISNEKAFASVLPKNFNSQKFIATFCLEVQKNPKLAECTNLVEVAREVATFGLVIGGLANQAHLIPFNKRYKDGNQWKSETKAQLVIGYKGYITKLEEAGYTVECEVVTEEELEKGFFQEIRGSETKIIHSPIRKGIRDRANIALAYCIIKHKDNHPIISVLSKEEIEEIGKTDKFDKNGNKTKSLSNVWLNEDRTTDYAQMCLKTVIRNAVKKVNLQIANEMSVYEGEKESEIIKEAKIASKTSEIESFKFQNGESLVKSELNSLTPEEIAEIEKKESEGGLND